MFEKVREIIAYLVCIDASYVTETSTLVKDLGADNIDMLDLALELEDQFDIEVPSEDLEQFITVGDIIEYLKKKGIEE